MVDNTQLQQAIDALRPWRYNHRFDSFVIHADDPRSAHVHDAYGKDIMAHLTKVLIGDHNPAEMRALDLGCLEGHYSDLLCKAGFKEVVSVDLSEGHIERARFLLQE